MKSDALHLNIVRCTQVHQTSFPCAKAQAFFDALTCIKLCFDQLALITFRLTSVNRSTSVDHSSNQFSIHVHVLRTSIRCTKVHQISFRWISIHHFPNPCTSYKHSLNLRIDQLELCSSCFALALIIFQIKSNQAKGVSNTCTKYMDRY